MLCSCGKAREAQSRCSFPSLIRYGPIPASYNAVKHVSSVRVTAARAAGDHTAATCPCGRELPSSYAVTAAGVVGRAVTVTVTVTASSTT